MRLLRCEDCGAIMSQRGQYLSAKQKSGTKIDFDAVMKLGAALPGVTASSGARSISLKLKGQLVACTAINPSAEPDSLMVCIDFAARDFLLEQHGDIYYTTSHYRGYAAVLVRLARVGRPELQSLLEQAVQFVAARRPKKTREKAAKKPVKGSVRKTSKLALQRQSRRS